ncbi:NADP-dependent oxidoreductase [Kocuria rosea]|uniref:Alcohol dehydrogenase n=1 Tax=Kocuria rosea subsp. polaris TaxID=136273 RepID=A0A0A6VSJ4_KOCRO|nr:MULTISPECIES: NADP-dependent oxidoreductase [Kocuria]MCC5783605.1 NADP-dependent oxidoreductase [Kocuria sp. CCUG 69068]KHD96739.1 alcohol dehydrogenase [Kocuria polaris]MEB2528292.1 NADP-dependent oxidoreductase [Kocuria rosea]MEB2618352.1 NADP-dependent oxidoreductase [Kocuria rosea]NVC23334.1 NADP-dependent oxidoreductase [Kocuria salina]
MKALTYARYGGPEVLELTDLPEPKVPPGWVLLKVRSAAINPVDWKIMAGGLDPLMEVQFPVVPGWDVSGVVEAVGIDVPEWAPGDEVISYARTDWVHGGTMAEYVALPARLLAPKPASVDWDRAAALPLAGLTAYQVLGRLEAAAGETVLVHNASGGVGGYAVQLAAARGARVIGTASEANHEYLRGLGAEPVAYGDGLPERVRELAPDGVDVVVDLVGGVVEQTLAVLKDGGRHASVADDAVEAHGGTWMWVRPSAEDLTELGRLVDRGALRIELARSVPLAEGVEAYRLSQEGHVRGKIAVRMA